MKHILFIFDPAPSLQPYYSNFIRWHNCSQAFCLVADKIRIDSLPQNQGSIIHYIQEPLTHKVIQKLILEHSIQQLVYFYLDHNLDNQEQLDYFSCPSICHYFNRYQNIPTDALITLRKFDKIIVTNPSLAMRLQPLLENVVTIPFPHLAIYSFTGQTQLLKQTTNKFLIGCDLSYQGWASELDVILEMISLLDKSTEVRNDFHFLLNIGIEIDNDTDTDNNTDNDKVNHKFRQEFNTMCSYHRVNPNNLTFYSCPNHHLLDCHLYLCLNEEDFLGSKILFYGQHGIPVIASETNLTHDLVINGITVKPIRYSYDALKKGYLALHDIPKLVNAIISITKRDYATQTMSHTLATCYALCLGPVDNYQRTYLPILEELDQHYLGKKSTGSIIVLDFNPPEVIKYHQQLLKSTEVNYYHLDTTPSESEYRSLLLQLLDTHDFLIQLEPGDLIFQTDLNLTGLCHSLLRDKSGLLQLGKKNSSTSYRNYSILRKTSLLLNCLENSLNLPMEQIAYNLDPFCFWRLVKNNSPILDRHHRIFLVYLEIFDDYNNAIEDMTQTKTIFNQLSSLTSLVKCLPVKMDSYRKRHFIIKDYQISLKQDFRGEINGQPCQWSLINGLLYLYFLSNNELIELSLNLEHNVLSSNCQNIIQEVGCNRDKIRKSRTTVIVYLLEGPQVGNISYHSVSTYANKNGYLLKVILKPELLWTTLKTLTGYYTRALVLDSSLVITNLSFSLSQLDKQNIPITLLKPDLGQIPKYLAWIKLDQLASSFWDSVISIFDESLQKSVSQVGLDYFKAGYYPKFSLKEASGKREWKTGDFLVYHIL